MTLDAGPGHYRLYQLREGHRFSTDDVLTAWYGTLTAPRAERCLDLGSGIGSVATFAAWRLAGSRWVTCEAQAESVRLARRSHAHNGLEGRVTVVEGDFRERAAELVAGGPYDLITGSPPYFPLGSGVTSEHPQKVACRFEVRGDVGDYARAAAAAGLAPGGVFACVFPIDPPHQRERIEAAARDAGLTIFRECEVTLRAGEAPLLGLFAMVRTGDLPAGWVRYQDPGLIIRGADGKTTAQYLAVKLTLGLPPTG